MANSSNITIDYIGNTVGNSMKRKETNLKQEIESLGDNPSTQDLLMVQQDVAEWTLLTQIQSTLVKEVADAMKGVIQKAG